MIGRHDEGGSHWLFSEERVSDMLLDSMHQVVAKCSHDGRVNPGRHDAERISRRHEAVVWFQVFEPTLNNSDTRQPLETLAKSSAHQSVWVNEPEIFDHQLNNLQLRLRRVAMRN